MKMNKFPVVEIFESIQGEGIMTGVPSVFIRTTGCNLRCAWKNSICDSAYTSHHPEKPLWTTPEEIVEEIFKIKSPETNHFVFTGGEPMLHQKGMKDVIDLIDERMIEKEGRISHVTVETNATIVPEWEILDVVDLWSLSPKLESSCCFEGTDISEGARELHRKTRFNPKALLYYTTYGLEVQMKFVWCGEETMKEVDGFFNDLLKYAKENKEPLFGEEYEPELFEYGFNGMSVQLMPAGQTEEQINQNAKSAIAACIARGWRYCDRTHIRIWGDKRKV